MTIERLNIAVHSGERCGLWASGFVLLLKVDSDDACSLNDIEESYIM